jgi:hypothetical protein
MMIEISIKDISNKTFLSNSLLIYWLVRESAREDPDLFLFCEDLEESNEGHPLS